LEHICISYDVNVHAPGLSVSQSDPNNKLLLLLFHKIIYGLMFNTTNIQTRYYITITIYELIILKIEYKCNHINKYT
jgi:hypothetical protein